MAIYNNRKEKKLNKKGKLKRERKFNEHDTVVTLDNESKSPHGNNVFDLNEGRNYLCMNMVSGIIPQVKEHQNSQAQPLRAIGFSLNHIYRANSVYLP